MPAVRIYYKVGSAPRRGTVSVSSKTPTESEIMAALKKKHKNDVAKGKDIVILEIG